LLREVDALHAGHVLGWRAADTGGDYNRVDFEDDAIVWVRCEFRGMVEERGRKGGEEGERRQGGWDVPTSSSTARETRS
jgi:hypothetical protein